MNVCVIDIGSNTVKATIFRINKNGTKSVVAYKGFKERLISGLEQVGDVMNLKEEFVNRLFDAFSRLVSFAEEYDCKNTYAFATAVLRNADNGDEIVNAIYERFSIKVEIISGEEEALCSLKGLLSGEDTNGCREGIMLDMGGGSTEIVYFKNGESPKITSLSFGCLSLFESFVSQNVPDKNEEKSISAFVIDKLKDCQFIKDVRVPVFLIGGTARAVVKLINNKRSFHLRADGSDFCEIIRRMKDEDYFKKSESIITGRSTTVVPGAIAYRAIMDYIKPTSISVSESGVREGYLEKILP